MQGKGTRMANDHIKQKNDNKNENKNKNRAKAMKMMLIALFRMAQVRFTFTTRKQQNKGEKNTERRREKNVKPQKHRTVHKAIFISNKRITVQACDVVPIT